MYKAFIVLTFILLIICVVLLPVNAQTNQFSYQGSLKNGANPASGNYDITVEIYDAETSGNLLDLVNFPNVAVENGIFTLNINTNPSVFSGAARYVQLKVRRSGTNDFTTMSPRQLVTSAPYALKSLNAETANNALQLDGVNANQFVQTSDSRLSDSRPPTAGSANYIQNTMTRQESSNFNISGNGIIGGRLGIGTSNPKFSLHVIGQDIRVEGDTTDTYPRLSFNFTGGAANERKWQNYATTNGLSFSALNDTEFQETRWLFVYRGTGTAINSVHFLKGNIAIGDFGMPEAKLHVFGKDMRVQSTAPEMFPRYSLYYTNAQPNTGKWQNYARGDGLVFSALNDAETQEETWLRVSRLVGTNIIQTVEFPTGFVKINNWTTGGSTSVCRTSTNLLAACSSSIRYKQNVRDYGNGLGLIRKLRPVTFNWKADNKEDMGLIAEEVNAVEPLLTTTNEKGEVEGVKYDRVGVVLVNAVNEQQDQIEAQQKQINEQKEVIKKQQAKLDKQQSEIDELKVILCSQNPAAKICKEKKP